MFRAQLEVVRADVAVLRDGRPVARLGPASFDLRDNGVRQTIQSVLVEQVPVDVTLILDTST